VSLVEIPWRTGVDSITAALHGQPPDLCQLHAADLSGFLTRNALSDWSAGVADLRAGLRGWEMCMVGDAIYGLPWLLRTDALYFDKALMAKAGLDSTRAPDDWEELRAAAARIQRLGGGVHGVGVPAGDSGATLDRLLPFVWANDGDLLSAKLDSSRFGSP